MPAVRCLSSSGAARGARLLLGIAAAGLLASACTSGTPAGSSAQSQSPAPATAPASSTGPAAKPTAASPSPSPTVTSPGIVAVTTGGALVRLDPATGKAEQTLVSAGVLGDEISVSASGTTLFFAAKSGCTQMIETIASAGGTPTVLATGSVPAISPDGNLLAYADEPGLRSSGCTAGSASPASLFHLEIRNLSTGTTTALPPLPAARGSGLPTPISHLSWSADSAHLAVSIAAVQDNEGWLVNLVDTAKARYYLSGTGVTPVPVTGSPTPRQSYLREGVYLPDGGLFVSRACCGGVPVRNTSRLMWEVSPDGVLTRQVAIGFATVDHTSLDVSANGKWLLYLAGNDLYVSQGGARPRRVATGLTAAAWS